MVALFKDSGQSQIDPKRQLAEMLMMSAITPNQQAMQSGSPLIAAIGPILQALMARKASKQADLTDQERKASSEQDWQRILQAMQGTPENGQVTEGPTSTGGRTGTKEQIAQAMLQASNPNLRMMGLQQSLTTPESWEETPGPRGSLLQRNRQTGELKQIVSPESGRLSLNPYFSPVQTAEGIYAFDARTGKMSIIDAGEKKPVIGSQSDPNLQAKISYGKKVGQEIGDVDVQQHETAKSSLENINKIDNLISHLKASDAITGMGSDMLKNIERAKVLVANSKKAGKIVTDTEILDIMMGSEVFPLIKSLGIGARGMDTPAEREFMRSVLTGQIALNKGTLIRMAEIRRDIAKRAIDRWNYRVQRGEMDNYFSLTGRPKELIEVTQPSGGTLTPEEQKELDQLRRELGSGR